jgi:hypothetical protein
MPEIIHGIGVQNKTIISSDVHMDQNIVQILRKI